MRLQERIADLIERIEQGDLAASEELAQLTESRPHGLDEALRAISRARRREEDPIEHVHFRVRTTWEGDEGVQRNQPLRWYRPDRLSEVQAIVRLAEQEGVKARAVGTGLSYSDITSTTDFLIETSALSVLSPVARERLRDPSSAERYFEVGAGVTMRSLNARLESLGRALEVMPSYDGMTFVGAAQTGSHGSAPKLGELASLIRSVLLVTGGGRTLRIEPTNGVSKPSHEPGIDELIQDDYVFRAVVVGVGCFGVICSVIVESAPLQALEEVRTIHTWSQIRPRLPDLLEQHWVELWINPHEIDGERTVLLTTRNPTDKVPTKDRARRRHLPQVLSELPVASDVALWYLDLFPKQAASAIDGSLRALEDNAFIGPPSQVLVDVLAPNGFANEMIFSMGSPRYLDAIETYFEIARSEALLGKRFMSFVVLRFMAGSSAYFAMNHGGPAIAVELPTLSRWKGARPQFDRIERTMIEFGGRPHWALQFDTLTDAGGLVRGMYPRYSDFLAVLRELDPKQTFSNRFTDRIGLTTPRFGL